MLQVACIYRTVLNFDILGDTVGLWNVLANGMACLMLAFVYSW